MTIATAVVDAFTPTGKLRAAINLGNPVLAGRSAASGEPAGVSVDLANGFGSRLGVEVELLAFDAAGKSVDAVTSGTADLGFFAVDPLRGEGIAFSAPYVLIEGCYLVRDDSPLQSNDEVDRPGQRVAVGTGSAYDLFLGRELQHAEIVRAPTSPSVVDLFVEQRLEVAAGVRQQLLAGAAAYPGLRLLPGRFMVIQQAMGVARSRGSPAANALSAYVEEMKRSGFVAAALARHGVTGATLAPAAD